MISLTLSFCGVSLIRSKYLCNIHHTALWTYYMMLVLGCKMQNVFLQAVNFLAGVNNEKVNSGVTTFIF